MAITQCSRCGGQVSTNALVCPHCGDPHVEKEEIRVQKSYPSLGHRGGMESLIHPNEPVYFLISVIFSALIYVLLVVSIVGLGYVALGALFVLIVQGLLVGNLKGNAVQVSERQFPDLHQLVVGLSREMELPEVPDVYVVQSGGVLNAFATRFLGTDFVAIYSDVLELAYENGEPVVGFVMAHELAHVKRKHISRRALVLPAMWVPFLGKAYSRACEYTCDGFAAYCRPDGAADGILVLAAGKQLYTKVDIEEFQAQGERNKGFWAWFAEVLSTHPYLSKRLTALRKAGLLERPNPSRS